MPSRHFCTYFDRSYLSKGLALHRSLRRHCRSFVLWILCLDSETYDVLRRMDLPSVRLISLPELLEADPGLRAVASERERIDFYFTCSPVLPLRLLEGLAGAEIPDDGVTYLDADLYFFADPEPLFEEFGSGSVALIEHRFSPPNHFRMREGRFNVGWLTFRRDANALACLQWWRERCLEWCCATSDDDRYADQKYLDEFPERFGGVRVLGNVGGNVAPWNLGNYRVAARQDDGVVRIDGSPLIFYHFSGLRSRALHLYDLNLCHFKVRAERAVVQHVYAPYIRTLQDIEESVNPLLREATASPPATAETPPAGRGPDLSAALRAFGERVPHGIASLLNGDYQFVPPRGGEASRKPAAAVALSDTRHGRTILSYLSYLPLLLPLASGL